jgi:putative nucleotidyltransferase with HDIG domain
MAADDVPDPVQDPVVNFASPPPRTPAPPSARRTAVRLLQADQRRLHHSGAVAARAQALSITVPVADAELLVAAAWLHDIGYAPAIKDSGFHPLDGARYLKSAGWGADVCALVAHHSGARYVAALRGLSSEPAEFAYHPGPVADALTIADQTTAASLPVTIDDRMRDMLHRHGPDSPNSRAHHDREPYIRAAAARVIARFHDAVTDVRVPGPTDGRPS